jgi:hypothetical protein
MTSAPVSSLDETLESVPRLLKSLTMPRSMSTAPNRPLVPGSGLTQGCGSLLSTIIKRLIRSQANDTSMTSLVPSPGTEKVADDAGDKRLRQMEQTLERIEVLNAFSPKGLQDLTFVGSKVTEAKLVMSLNIETLRNVHQYYQHSLQASAGTSAPSPEVSDACQASIRSFERHVKGLEQLLQFECLRADALIKKIDDGKNLVSHFKSTIKTGNLPHS